MGRAPTKPFLCQRETFDGSEASSLTRLLSNQETVAGAYLAWIRPLSLMLH